MKLKLVEKKEEAKGTKSFFWEPEKQVSWLPGQFFYFTLPKLKYPDPRGATRYFTISSSPTEGSLLRNTTRIREESGYKKTLNELNVGEIIEGEGPNGTFILDENSSNPQIFLAGGIGITPFRSFIKYNLDKNLQIPMHLIYANSIPEEITFREELKGFAKDHPHIKVDMTISKPDQKWNGLTGRIDENLLKKLVPSAYLLGPSFWVCGPPPMVEAMEDLLGRMGMTSNRIHSEKFTGY